MSWDASVLFEEICERIGCLKASALLLMAGERRQARGQDIALVPPAFNFGRFSSVDF